MTRWLVATLFIATSAHAVAPVLDRVLLPAGDVGAQQTEPHPVLDLDDVGVAAALVVAVSQLAHALP